MGTKIKTTGELREFLANMLIAVKDGTMEADRARNVTKMAAQINESFYSEIKVMRVLSEAGKEASKFGALPINE